MNVFGIGIQTFLFFLTMRDPSAHAYLRGEWFFTVPMTEKCFEEEHGEGDGGDTVVWVWVRVQGTEPAIAKSNLVGLAKGLKKLRSSCRMHRGK